MCIHDCLGCVCVRACVYVYVPVRTEKDAMRVCVCTHVSVFEYDQHDWKRVLDHVLHERVPKNIYRGGLLCIFLLKASSRPV